MMMMVSASPILWGMVLLSASGKHAEAQRQGVLTPAERSVSSITQNLRGLGSNAAFVPDGRRLADAIEITLLAYYGSGTTGHADDEMKAFVEKKYKETNAAFVNSGIPELTIKVVDVLPYAGASTGDISIALNALEASEAVEEKRNATKADLVQLFGDFDTGLCGLACLPVVTTNADGEKEWDSDQAFSAVDPSSAECIDLRPHSHETGHNLGCDHNIEDVPLERQTNNAYAYGQRYCNDTNSDLSYITIMSYRGVDCAEVKVANYYSNPDITYKGRATGTTPIVAGAKSKNNAQAIRDNMLAVSRYRCCEDKECGVDDICCKEEHVCVKRDQADPTACGDPHMTGFRGQKFDFTGEDGAWYSLISDLSAMHLNMRVTAPVPSLPEITYITGLSLITTDADGLEHTIVIAVKDPHSLESSCTDLVPTCLAEGALNVILDGEEALLTPGTVMLGPGVAVSAVNLPGACRSFGFEKYWERKKLEYANGARRLQQADLDMADWILADPTATNMEECTEYVAQAMLAEGGLFAHESEHGSFQIVTPKATIRLSHGRLHQVATRDPTDQFDLPDHLTWQMNVGIDHKDVSRDATGILGETMVPTRDGAGNEIMDGMASIRGEQEDYRVAGPLGVVFTQGPRG